MSRGGGQNPRYLREMDDDDYDDDRRRGGDRGDRNQSNTRRSASAAQQRDGGGGGANDRYRPGALIDEDEPRLNMGRDVTSANFKDFLVYVRPTYFDKQTKEYVTLDPYSDKAVEICKDLQNEVHVQDLSTLDHIPNWLVGTPCFISIKERIPYFGDKCFVCLKVLSERPKGKYVLDTEFGSGYSVNGGQEIASYEKFENLYDESHLYDDDYKITEADAAAAMEARMRSTQKWKRRAPTAAEAAALLDGMTEVVKRGGGGSKYLPVQEQMLRGMRGDHQQTRRPGGGRGGYNDDDDYYDRKPQRGGGGRGGRDDDRRGGAVEDLPINF